LGDNAIYKMGRVLAAIETYARDVVPKLARHPLCGTPTLSVGTITGGLSVNTVPDVCTVEVDRRLVPGEDGEQAYQQVIEFIQKSGVDFPIEHHRPFQQGSTLANGPNAGLADNLSAVVRRLFGRCEQVGVPYGTDASRLSAAGVPCVVFGPGCIDQAHTADEWLSIAELEKASESLYQFGRVGLSG
jgi:acetylornithine deacetylase/succinyl-diaminopimelate desuccinylase-like protein